MISTLAAVAIGCRTLRLRGHYFAIATLLIARVCRSYSSAGLGRCRLGSLRAHQSHSPWLYLQFHTSKVPYYYLALAAAAPGYFLVWTLRRSRFGFRLQALRDEPDAAASLALPIASHKVMAFMISGAMMSVAGTFYGHMSWCWTPRLLFSAEISIIVLLMNRTRRQRHAVGAGAGSVQSSCHSPNTAASVSAAPAAPSIIVYGILIRPSACGPERHPEPVRRAIRPVEVGRLSLLLDVKGLTKRYGGLTANSDITFDVNEGEIVGIIGPNGAVKSTLFALITGFSATSDAGHVLPRRPRHHRGAARPHRRPGRGPHLSKLKPFPDLTGDRERYRRARGRTAAYARRARPGARGLAFVDLPEKRNNFGAKLSTVRASGSSCPRACHAATSHPDGRGDRRRRTSAPFRASSIWCWSSSGAAHHRHHRAQHAGECASPDRIWRCTLDGASPSVGRRTCARTRGRRCLSRGTAANVA